MKLIAIPYAAGTAYAMQTIQRGLKPYVKLDVFEYPGHGQKLFLPLLDSIQGLAKEMLKEMFPIHEPYCLLGYSLGGHVLCELYRLLIENHYPLPVHVFLCAIDIPFQQEKKELDVSDQALLEELQKLGGTDPEILENPEFMEILLPIYRADIVAEDNYSLPVSPLFECSGTVIVGKSELEKENHFSEWQGYFRKPIRMFDVSGGHFFIQESPAMLSDIINARIAEIL